MAWCLADGAAECVADAVGDGEAAALIGERQRESIALATSGSRRASGQHRGNHRVRLGPRRSGRVETPARYTRADCGTSPRSAPARGYDHARHVSPVGTPAGSSAPRTSGCADGASSAPRTRSSTRTPLAGIFSGNGWQTSHAVRGQTARGGVWGSRRWSRCR